MSNFRAKISKWLAVRNSLLKGFLAEFSGTLILIVIGDGSIAQSVLSRNQSGNFLTVNLSWGFGVTFGVFIAGSVTAGFINPAITLVSAIRGRISVSKCLVYMLAEYLGAFFGAAIVYGIYSNALDNFDGGKRQIQGPNGTAGIFATYPQSFLSVGSGLADQIFGTALLVGCVMSITDTHNSKKVPPYLIPLIAGFVVLAIGMTFGFNCGYAINPARDLSPRFFTYLAGWGTEVFSYRNYNWFWIPVVGPHIGAILGAFLYIVLISNHFEADKSHVEVVRTNIATE